MDLKLIRSLIRLLADSDVEELELEQDGRRLRLRRRGPGAAFVPAIPLPGTPTPAGVGVAPMAAPAGVPAEAGAPAAPAANIVVIESPMVGTFYRAPAPGAESYVKEGDRVEKGTVLCIIEAMKLMNEIEAEVRGKVVAILVGNAQPVEYGQPLFHIEPV